MQRPTRNSSVSDVSTFSPQRHSLTAINCWPPIYVLYTLLAFSILFVYVGDVVERLWDWVGGCNFLVAGA